MKIGKKIKSLAKIGLSLFCYKAKILRLPYLPLTLWIEPTNVCNLKCIMCPNSINVQKNPGFMDMELYKKIIKEAKNSISSVILCISGEPLLHKNFPQMVKLAKENGISTSVSTNGTLLTPFLSRKILKAGLDWINFSFDGCTKKTYEKVRVNAKFEKTLENIIEFLKIKKQIHAKTHSDLQILVMDKEGMVDYKNNIDKFLRNFEGLPLDFIQLRRPSTWGGYFKGTKKFQPKSLGNQFSPCSYLWSSIHVLWDGKIVACTSDFFGTNILGEYPKQSLREIWNNERMLKFRKAMLEQKYQKFNKNCVACDSLWEKRMFGFPPGIRGICVSTLNSVLGVNFFALFKKVAKLVNPSFSMVEVKNNSKDKQ